MKARKRGDNPPSAPEAERAVLACVLLANSTKEVDAILEQLRPAYFFEPNHQTIFGAMVHMRMENHAIDLITLAQWLKDRDTLSEAGGLDYLSPLPDAAASWINWPNYVPILAQKYQERRIRAGVQKLQSLALAETVDLEAVKAHLEDLAEVQSKATAPKTPLLRMISPSQARAFVPDPNDFMVGEGLIMRGAVVTIGGRKGIGKSRLTTTLAVAGARGTGDWMGFPVRSKWKTAIFQTENAGYRLKTEYEAVPKAAENNIRVADFMSHGMAFGNADYRRAVQQFYKDWPFDMMVIDPWNNVSYDTGQKDYMEALYSLQSLFSEEFKRPAIVIVAHLKKERGERGRLRGRDLIDEISGSLCLATTSRSIFAVQAASADPEDTRIIFEVAASNDCPPDYLREYGSRSAWHRANAAFERCHDFDWAAWDGETDKEPEAAVTIDMVQGCMAPGEWIRPALLVKELMKLDPTVKSSTAFRYLSAGHEFGQRHFDREDSKLRLKVNGE